MSEKLNAAAVAEKARAGDVFTYYDGTTVRVEQKKVDGGSELVFKPSNRLDHPGLPKGLFLRTYDFKHFTKGEAAKTDGKTDPKEAKA